MAAMMSGTMRAPLTGSLFAAELTGDYAMLPALLAASSVAYATTVLLLKRSILTEKIARRGLHLTREYSVDLFRIMRVRDVMVEKVDTLPVDMPAREAVEFFTGSVVRHKSYPVVDGENRVIGMAARAQILRWMSGGAPEGVTLGQAVQEEPLCGYPDELVSDLIERMVDRDVGRVPIVDRDGRLVGLVSRKDLLRVHSRERAEEVERAASPPLFGARPAEA
jgi:CBS domain-containing protein